MPKLDAQELRKQKAERFQKAIRLEKPDRTPFCFLLGISAFLSNNAGYSVADISHDYDKFFRAMIKFAEDFDHDWGFAFPGLANQVTITFIEDHPEIAPSVGLMTAPMHDILQDNYTRWPGRELGDDIAPQFIGGKFLEIDEYDLLIEDPKKCLNEVVLPRAYRSLAKSDSAEAYGALIKWGMEVSRFGAAMGAAFVELSNIGYPLAPVSTCNNPYDLIADFIRHFDNTIMDFHRAPDKLKQAAEAILPFSLKFVDISTKVPPEMKQMYDIESPLVFYPLHLNEFLHPKLYREYYWPLLKKLIEADVEAGRVPLIFFEGDHTPHLETFLDLPKGKIIAYFERPDWNEVAKVLKGHQCAMGALPPSLLISGTPQKVEDHVRRMVDLFDGTGFILSYAQSSLPKEVKAENLTAAVEALRKIG